MKKRLVYLLLVILCAFPVYCCASDPSAVTHNTASSTIHTYGGGELFEKVLNAISMVVYGNAPTGIGKTFSGFIRIALILGGFSAVCLAFFREKFEPLVTNFFLPAIGITTLLLVPRTTVYIQDHLAQKSIEVHVSGVTKVDNVPFFLGKIAALTSTLSYYFTSALEKVTHGTNEAAYNWTGHIYASDSLFKTRKCRIANPLIEDNLREFCHECVFRDLGIGLYTKKDLVQTPDILKFLEEHTSSIRTTFFKTEGSATSGLNSVQGEFLPCKSAISRLRASLNGSDDAVKGIVFGETTSDIGFLLGQQVKSKNDFQKLLHQQASIDILKEELPGTLNSFAAKRAEYQQQENQKILGALGANSIVSMRNFFEATIYMVFPLIIIISLLSFGIKPLISWLQFLLWVNTWPPFYVVVNFLLNSIWTAKKRLSWGESLDLTLFSSEGLSDLYNSMESTAAIAMAFIPFLSWVILKGGVSQMVHLASSLTSSSQSAAAVAASEKTTGNYSFGNVTYDTSNAYNTQMNKQSYSGMMAAGSIGIERGGESFTYVPQDDKLFLKQSDSYLREGISRSETFSASLQDSLSSSETSVLETSSSVSNAITDASNKAVGFSEALSKHLQSGESLNAQHLSGVQESFQYIKSVADEYATANGVSKDRAFRELFSASFGLSSGLFGIKASGEASGSYQDGVTRNESYSKLEKAAQSDSYQQHMQTIKNLSRADVASLLGSEEAKLHEDFVSSLSQAESAVENWRAAYSKQQALSNMQHYASSENLTLHQNLNQSFIDFLGEKYGGDTGLITETSNLSNAHPHKKALINEFASSYLPQKFVSPSIEDPSRTEQHILSSRGEEIAEQFGASREQLLTEGQEKLGTRFGSLNRTVGKLRSEISSFQQETSLSEEQHLESLQKGSDHALGYKQIKRSVDKNNNRLLGKAALGHLMLFQGIPQSLQYGQRKGKELLSTWFKEKEE